MTKRILSVFLINFILLTALSTQGAIEKRSKTLFDDVIQQGETQMTLSGIGLRTAILGIKVYAIAHYMPANTFKTPPTHADIVNAIVSKRLVLKFLRKVKGSKIVSSYQESLPENNPNVYKDKTTLTKVTPYINTFLETMNQTVVETDEVHLQFLPNKGIEIVMPRQKVSRVIPSPELAKMVWNVWFGPEPPSPGKELQKKLISKL
jgi:hypothetical protein